jgi:ribosomal protein S18 acetylase RimI-like enzyme
MNVMDICERPCGPEDDGFLLELYASTRQDVAQWGWSAAEQEAFLRMQFEAQRRSYQSESPQAEWRIILEDDRPIGRLIVEQRPHEINLMDIALLPERRNRGMGARLIRNVMERAARLGLPVRLCVRKENPGALRLYRRLGFVVIEEMEMDFLMEWLSSPPQKARE